MHFRRSFVTSQAGLDMIVDASRSACATMISIIYTTRRKLSGIEHECVRHTVQMRCGRDSRAANGGGFDLCIFEPLTAVLNVQRVKVIAFS